MRSPLLVFLLAALLPLLAEAAPSRPALVGALYNLTGGQAALDVPSWQGAQLAAEHLEREGRCNVSLVVRDGRTDPEALARGAEALLHLRPSAVIGLSDTDMLRAAAPPLTGAGIPFVTSGATSPKLPAQVQGPLLLACFGDNGQAAAAAEFAWERLGARRVVLVVNEEMEYTRLLAGYFQERFEGLGGEVVAKVPSPTGPPVDLVYLAAGPEDAPKGVRALRAAGFEGPILGGDAFDSPAFDGPDAPEGVYFTTHAFLGAGNEDPLVRRFVRDYEAAWPGCTPDAFSALGYDAVLLVSDALARAGSADPAAVARALEETREFRGVTGTMRFPPGQRVPVKSVSILRTSAAGPVLAQELTPRVVPAP